MAKAEAQLNGRRKAAVARAFRLQLDAAAFRYQQIAGGRRAGSAAVGVAAGAIPADVRAGVPQAHFVLTWAAHSLSCCRARRSGLCRL